MKKEKFERLKVGDRVYLFYLDISYHHHINMGIAAELEKTGDTEFFKVVKVISGRILKVGETVKVSYDRFSRFSPYSLFEKFRDGVEWWNIKIRNAEDGLTSEYEKKKKGLLKRLIQL